VNGYSEASKTSLDNELDVYMGRDPEKAKLDLEMDEYSSQGKDMNALSGQPPAVEKLS